MIRTRVASTAILAIAAATLAACSSSSSGSSGSAGSAGSSGTAAGSAAASSSPSLAGNITVFAAASLTGSFTDLGKQFETAHPGTKVTFSFLGSATLATQINQGAPADVFASAAPANMKTVTDAGNAIDPTNFAANSLEIAVPTSNPAGIRQLSDLAKSGVKVALCQPAVPCGATAQATLTKSKVTVTPVTQESDVKSVLAKVSQGEVDAGIVYVTDVKAAASTVQGIEIPADQNTSTEYPIATLKNSAHADVAKAFVAYVSSAAGQKVLQAAGFASA